MRKVQPRKKITPAEEEETNIEQRRSAGPIRDGGGSEKRTQYSGLKRLESA